MNTEKNDRRKAIIVILAIALALAVGLNFYFFIHERDAGFTVVSEQTSSTEVLPVLNSKDFRDPVKNKDAADDMNNYGGGNDVTKAVFYEKKDIDKYFTCIWPNLIKLNPDQSKYHWVVGFYFVRKLVDTPNNIRKLTFYVAPTLVKNQIDNLSNKPLDFGSHYTDATIYNQNPMIPVCPADSAAAAKGTTTITSNAYDAGELWP
jgi:hypothetical protein